MDTTVTSSVYKSGIRQESSPTMVAILSFLYRFVTAPIQTISKETPSFSTVLLVSGLYTLSVYATAGIRMGPWGWASMTLICVIAGLGCGALIDTLAQLFFKKQPQGLRLGYWLVVLQLPSLLGFPLGQLTITNPTLLGISQFTLSMFVLWLYYRALQTLYEISGWRSVFLIIALPILFLGTAILIGITTIGYFLHLF